MRIAVTGASGFIGMELLAVLNKRNDVSVTALTRDASRFEARGCCEAGVLHGAAESSGEADTQPSALEAEEARVECGVGVQPTAAGTEGARVEWRSTDYSYKSLAAIFGGEECAGGECSAGSDHSACTGRRSESSAETAFSGGAVDTVIHLAGVRGTEDDPEKFAVNVSMTENILRAMEACGVKRIVFASTMSVYNDDSLMPWSEDAPLRGRSAYGDSKADCEDLIRKYAGRNKTGKPGSGPAAGSGKESCGGFTYGIVRIAQVLGEGEKRRGMMNVFIDTARAHGTLKVMGKSVVKKQYIYVKDLAEILALLACGHICHENITINAGMTDAYSNLEIAQLVNMVFGNPEPIDYDDSYPEKGRPFHMDTARLRNVLGYEPLDMEAALREMAGQKSERRTVWDEQVK